MFSHFLARDPLCRKRCRPAHGSTKFPTRENTSAEGWNRCRSYLLLTLLLAICAGCRSLPASGPVDFSEPGWIIRQGQAVWYPKPKADIAGELLVAMHPDGRSVVQFSKPPLPFVEAQRGTNSWRIRFFAQNKEYAGRGSPPGRIGWLQLPDGLAGRPMDPNWSLIPPRPDGTGLHFENLETKETLDGFLATIRLPETHP